jgi:hypothetical protein
VFTNASPIPPQFEDAQLIEGRVELQPVPAVRFSSEGLRRSTFQSGQSPAGKAGTWTACRCTDRAVKIAHVPIRMEETRCHEVSRVSAPEPETKTLVNLG